MKGALDDNATDMEKFKKQRATEKSKPSLPAERSKRDLDHQREEDVRGPPRHLERGSGLREDPREIEWVLAASCEN